MPTPTEVRLPLTRERLLEAAVRLADEGGIQALTMRKLGEALGVEAMSLYNHVANKDEILSGMLDLVEGGIVLPDDRADWKEALRSVALSAHDAFERHPWAASLTLSPLGIRSARLRYMNALLGFLRRAGFSAETTDLAYHALESHIAGFTLWSSGLTVGDGALPDLATAFLGEIQADEFPYVVEHVEQHLRQRSSDNPGSFVFGLDLILDGFVRIRNQLDLASRAPA